MIFKLVNKIKASYDYNQKESLERWLTRKLIIYIVEIENFLLLVKRISL